MLRFENHTAVNDNGRAVMTFAYGNGSGFATVDQEGRRFRVTLRTGNSNTMYRTRTFAQCHNAIKWAAKISEANRGVA